MKGLSYTAMQSVTHGTNQFLRNSVTSYVVKQLYPN